MTLDPNSFAIDGFTMNFFRYSYLEEENTAVIAFNLEQLPVP